MAWTTAAGAGTTDWDQILFELMIAIEERFSILDAGNPSWPSPWGSAPLLAEFEGVKIHGTDGETKTQEMIEDIQAYTESLFTEFASGGSYNWRSTSSVDVTLANQWASFAALLTDVGYGASWLDVNRLADKRIVLQLQGALDRLKYPIWRVARTFIQDAGTSHMGIDDDNNRLTAWNGAVAVAPGWSAFPDPTGGDEWCGYHSGEFPPPHADWRGWYARGSKTVALGGVGWLAAPATFQTYETAFSVDVFVQKNDCDVISKSGTLSLSTGDTWTLGTLTTQPIQTSAWQVFEMELTLTDAAPNTAWWTGDNAYIFAKVGDERSYASISGGLTYG